MKLTGTVGMYPDIDLDFYVVEVVNEEAASKTALPMTVTEFMKWLRHLAGRDIDNYNAVKLPRGAAQALTYRAIVSFAFQSQADATVLRDRIVAARPTISIYCGLLKPWRLGWFCPPWALPTGP